MGAVRGEMLFVWASNLTSHVLHSLNAQEAFGMFAPSALLSPELCCAAHCGLPVPSLARCGPWRLPTSFSRPSRASWKRRLRPRMTGGVGFARKGCCLPVGLIFVVVSVFLEVPCKRFLFRPDWLDKILRRPTPDACVQTQLRRVYILKEMCARGSWLGPLF